MRRHTRKPDDSRLKNFTLTRQFNVAVLEVGCGRFASREEVSTTMKQARIGDVVDTAGQKVEFRCHGDMAPSMFDFEWSASSEGEKTIHARYTTVQAVTLLDMVQRLSELDAGWPDDAKKINALIKEAKVMMHRLDAQGDRELESWLARSGSLK